MTLVPPNDCSVLIVGGGPCGLMLANELGRRADLALIRPDQFVAWRGNSDEAGAEIIGRVLGF